MSAPHYKTLYIKITQVTHVINLFAHSCVSWCFYRLMLKGRERAINSFCKFSQQLRDLDLGSERRKERRGRPAAKRPRWSSGSPALPGLRPALSGAPEDARAAPAPEQEKPKLNFRHLKNNSLFGHFAAEKSNFTKLCTPFGAKPYCFPYTFGSDDQTSLVLTCLSAASWAAFTFSCISFLTASTSSCAARATVICRVTSAFCIQTHKETLVIQTADPQLDRNKGHEEATAI